MKRLFPFLICILCILFPPVPFEGPQTENNIISCRTAAMAETGHTISDALPLSPGHIYHKNLEPYSSAYYCLPVHSVSGHAKCKISSENLGRLNCSLLSEKGKTIACKRERKDKKTIELTYSLSSNRDTYLFFHIRNITTKNCSFCLQITNSTQTREPAETKKTKRENITKKNTAKPKPGRQTAQPETTPASINKGKTAQAKNTPNAKTTSKTKTTPNVKATPKTKPTPNVKATPKTKPKATEKPESTPTTSPAPTPAENKTEEKWKRFLEIPLSLSQISLTNEEIWEASSRQESGHLLWSSTHPEVATVTEGTVVLHARGVTVIYCRRANAARGHSCLIHVI